MNYTYLIEFIDANNEKQSITVVAPMLFELRYDDNDLFRLSEYVNSGEEKSNINTILEKLNTKCKDLYIYIILDNENYLLKYFENINYLISTLALARRDNEIGSDTYSDFMFVKNLEIR